MTNLFIIPLRLTVIKSMKDAREVLDETNEKNVLYVVLENGEHIKFVKNGESKVLVTDLNENSNPFNTIEIEMDMIDAVKILYKNRKYFNLKYKD